MVGMSVLSAFSQITCTWVGGDQNASGMGEQMEIMTHRNPIWVFLPDALCLGLALLYTSYESIVTE